MYVLDTDICSYLMKRAQPALIERVKTFAPRDLKVSVVTIFELEYGIRPQADSLGQLAISRGIAIS